MESIGVFPTFVRASTDDLSQPSLTRDLPSLLEMVAAAGGKLHLVPQRALTKRVVPRSTQRRSQATEPDAEANSAAEDSGAEEPGDGLLVTRTSWVPSSFVMEHYGIHKAFLAEWMALHGVRCSAGIRLDWNRSLQRAKAMVPPLLFTLDDLRVPSLIHKSLARKLQQHHRRETVHRTALGSRGRGRGGEGRGEGGGREHRRRRGEGYSGYDDTSTSAFYPQLNDASFLSFEEERLQNYKIEQLQAIMFGGQNEGAEEDASPSSLPSAAAQPRVTLRGLQHFALSSMLLGHHTILHGPPQSGKRIAMYLGASLNVLSLGVQEATEAAIQAGQLPQDLEAKGFPLPELSDHTPRGVLLLSSVSDVFHCAGWIRDVYGAAAFELLRWDKQQEALTRLELRDEHHGVAGAHSRTEAPLPSLEELLQAVNPPTESLFYRPSETSERELQESAVCHPPTRAEKQHAETLMALVTGTPGPLESLPGAPSHASEEEKDIIHSQQRRPTEGEGSHYRRDGNSSHEGQKRHRSPSYSNSHRHHGHHRHARHHRRHTSSSCSADDGSSRERRRERHDEKPVTHLSRGEPSTTEKVESTKKQSESRWDKRRGCGDDDRLESRRDGRSSRRHHHRHRSSRDRSKERCRHSSSLDRRTRSAHQEERPDDEVKVSLEEIATPVDPTHSHRPPVNAAPSALSAEDNSSTTAPLITTEDGEMKVLPGLLLPSYLTLRVPLLLLTHRDVADIMAVPSRHHLDEDSPQTLKMMRSVDLPLERVRVCALFDADKVLHPQLQQRLTQVHWVSLMNAMDVDCQILVSARHRLEEVQEFSVSAFFPDAEEDEIWTWSLADESIWYFTRVEVEAVQVRPGLVSGAEGNEEEEEDSYAMAHSRGRGDDGGRRRPRVTELDIDVAKLVQAAHCICDVMEAESEAKEEPAVDERRTDHHRPDKHRAVARPGVVVCCGSRREQQTILQHLPNALLAEVEQSARRGKGRTAAMRVTTSPEEFGRQDGAEVLVVCDSQLLDPHEQRTLAFQVAPRVRLVVHYSIPKGTLFFGPVEGITELLSTRSRRLLGDSRALWRRLVSTPTSRTSFSSFAVNGVPGNMSHQIPSRVLLTDHQLKGRAGERIQEVMAHCHELSARYPDFVEQKE